jgi:hypothetical protein
MLAECAVAGSPLPPVDPALLKLLSLEERCHYDAMLSAIATDVQRAHKHSGVSEFVRHMSVVHGFIARGSVDDAMRGVVCGVEFGRGFLLVNTDRLKRVLFRSKSCMNGCFQRLGYDVMRPSQDIVCLFSRLMPNVNPELFAIRQWCVRLVGNSSVVFFTANLPETLSFHFHPAMTDTRRFVARPNPAPANFLNISSLLNRPFDYP